MKLSNSSYVVSGLSFLAPWLVNAGIIAGSEKTLIIDTGGNMLGGQTIYGYATAVKPDNRLIVFNCEPHFDHIGGNSFLKDQGAELYGHPDIQRTAEGLGGEKVDINQSIIDPARKAAGEEEAFFVGTTVVNPDHSAVAGDKFDLGGLEVEILATPGHTEINQSVYNRAEKVLFCADCIVTDYIPNLAAGNPELCEQWLQSLEMIETLAPAVVVPGHGRVMRGEEIGVEIERVRGFLHQALVDGKAPAG